MQGFCKIGDNGSFIKAERFNAMVLMAWVMPDVIKMDFTWADYDKLLDKVKELAGKAEAIPPWATIRAMPAEEVDALIAKLGIASRAFEIDKREYLTKIFEFLERKMNADTSLRYLKVMDPSALIKTRKDLPELRESVRKRFANGGFEGKGINDFSIIYDKESALYRMWYIGINQYEGEQPATLLGYAESSDGIYWIRKAGKFAKGTILNFKNAGKVTVIKCDDGLLRMAISGNPPEDSGISPGDAYILESNDGMNWKISNSIQMLSEGRVKGKAFDDNGINNMFLGQYEGKYFLYYGGNLNEWDKAFPTRDEFEKMGARDLYKYAEMVGFRMSRNRNYINEYLPIAKTALEESDNLSKLPDETIRNLALYYRLEFDLTDTDLIKIDREMLIFSIRKSFLNRTFTQYGKTIYYPSVKEIETMDHPVLVENCGKYGIKMNDKEPTDEVMRDALKTFVILCDGKEEDLGEFSQDELIKLINDYSLAVKIEAVRDLPKHVGNIPRKTIEEKLASTLKDRRQGFIDQQRIVTRIGLMTTTDFQNWEKHSGDQIAGSVVTNDPRGFENPLVKAEGEFNKMITILGWFAVGLGLINLSRHHGLNIAKRGKNYMMSLSFFIAFFISIIIMPLYYPYYSRFIQVPNPYKFIQNFVAEPIIACILGLLGYYITSAAYRAFRVKNAEAAMMMLIAVLCMLGNISVFFEPLSRKLFLHTCI